jgi:hypothetical protein
MVDRALSTRQNADKLGRGQSEARILRYRITAHEDALDLLGAQDLAGTPRLLVQVYNGGSMPNAVPRVYFTHPVLAYGTETEGGSYTLSADTATTIPVIVLNKVPSVGDYLTAYSVGGRWVSEETNGGSSGIPCSPCSLPTSNLTVSWTNPILGNGSATMTYTASPESWTTGCCDGGIYFQLFCTGSSIELRAYFFTSGSCPTGTTSYCSNLGSAPLQLTLSNHTCSPLSLTFTVNGTDCPTLFSDGNTRFTVTV